MVFFKTGLFNNKSSMTLYFISFFNHFLQALCIIFQILVLIELCDNATPIGREP